MSLQDYTVRWVLHLLTNMVTCISVAWKHAFIAAALLFMGFVNHASADYPERPINLVYPWPAGSATDLLVREFASLLSEEIGGRVIVVNRPGGASVVGTNYVAQAEPDGYTLLFGSTALAANPPTMDTLPYDVLNDFESVAYVGRAIYIMAAKESLPVNDVREMLALAEQNPGELTVGTYGFVDLVLSSLELETGTDFLHVPFPGGAAAFTAILSETVDLTILPSSYVDEDTEGVKAIGVGGDERFASLPDVPTFDEQGVPGFEMSNWFCILAPRGTPEEIRDVLAQAIERVVLSPEYAEVADRLNVQARYMPPSELTSYIQAETERWERTVRAQTAGQN